MFLKAWDEMPRAMRNAQVRKYYEILEKKKSSLAVKRIFDVAASLLVMALLLPLFVMIGIAIKLDSEGPVFFRQTRITQYGRRFRIFKFRTMVHNAEKMGTQVTTRNDRRVTRVGVLLRKFRLDEIPQLFNILAGDMTFVGTRPEVEKYVEHYTDEMRATLLLPAGVTSETSIHYKDEEQLLAYANDADATYLKVILPEKMKYNLASLEKFGFLNEVRTMVRTVNSVLR